MKRITSLELAALCGVSQGTVDRALNNRPGISEKTRRRILQAAEENGYVKDMRASSLVSGKSGLLGLVLFDLRNEFFAQLATAAEARARELGYTVLLLLTERDLAREQDCILRLRGMGADGLILCPIGKGQSYAQWLAGQGLPLATVSNRLSERFPHVGLDDEAAMAACVRHTAERGYRRLIYVYSAKQQESSGNIDAQRRRYEGFLKASSALPLETVLVTDSGYIDAVCALLSGSETRTAVLLPSDYQALRLLLALRERGIDVPGEVGVVGFDNIAMLRYIRPRPATVGYSIEAIGAGAVDCVLKNAPAGLVPFEILPGETL